MYSYSHGSDSPTAKINLRHAGRLRMLPIGHEDGFFHDPTSFFAKCGNLSVEELFHMRMAHMQIEKLAKMNGQVDGLPSSLHFTKLLNLPCHCCHEA
eukprot:1285561-Rhodomonas_salina.1